MLRKTLRVPGLQARSHARMRRAVKKMSHDLATHSTCIDDVPAHRIVASRWAESRWPELAHVCYPHEVKPAKKFRDIVDVFAGEGLTALIADEMYDPQSCTALEGRHAEYDVLEFFLSCDDKGDRITPLKGDPRTVRFQEPVCDLLLFGDALTRLEDTECLTVCRRMLNAVRPGGAISLYSPFGPGASRLVHNTLDAKKLQYYFHPYVPVMSLRVPGYLIAVVEVGYELPEW